MYRCLVALLVCWMVLPPDALGGGGPENVLLVVNPQSRDSMTVANHYIRLRQIPPLNVYHLPWDPKAQTTDVATFRKAILIPVLKTIETRGLASQIDYVVYSADYPWAIDAKADVERLLKREREAAEKKDQGDKPKPPAAPRWPKLLRPTCSLNGLTYLWQPVLAGEPRAYIALRNNQYMRRAVPQQKDAPTLGFQSSDRFGSRGERVDGQGAGYCLSVVLGITAGRGNSVHEVLDYLRRAAGADGTHPKGTIYFVQNGNIRSRIRQRAFPAAVKGLDELGVTAKILEGVLPKDKDNVQGVMIGAAGFDWKKSGSTILPGAICEHLTSYGGVMRADAGQTPLSELLRHGAAGASGTVVEPFALQDKFPLAMIHVHYARGCTLAEAFYQSVHGPYQLLIVGDPLCRPWANIPKVAVEGIRSGQIIKGTVKLTPTATFAKQGKIDHFELFVDGRRTTIRKPGESLELDTTKLADGHHELRVVAVEAGPIRSQGRQIVEVAVDNHGRKLTASLAPPDQVAVGATLTLTANCPGAKSIEVRQDARVLGVIRAAKGQLKIDTAKLDLGFGPVRLRAVALFPDNPKARVFGPPLEVTVVAEQK